jgi:asparagine synthetase B (glutamine-hydrolysing)
MPFHLRGEFAFVLYDVGRRLLFVARDRFAIKPLYYTVDNGRILVASEIKAFMGLGWKAEWDIDSIIHDGDFCDDRTVFNGVRKVFRRRMGGRMFISRRQFPPGHFAVCRASGHMSVQPYWDLSYPAASDLPSSTIETMISTVREHLVDAVRLRLRSDVPLAVYLSGGIDSSAIAGIAAHLLREENPDATLDTFTLAYPGTQHFPYVDQLEGCSLGPGPARGRNDGRVAYCSAYGRAHKCQCAHGRCDGGEFGGSVRGVHLAFRAAEHHVSWRGEDPPVEGCSERRVQGLGSL